LIKQRPQGFTGDKSDYHYAQHNEEIYFGGDQTEEGE
jgi:hypothetical protein